MFKSLKRSAKGAAVPHTKATAGQPTNKMPVPEHVVLPMSMHIGAPAEPVVKKGDTVKVIAGKDKDKEGKVIAVNQKTGKVIVEGVNMLTKHTKPSAQNQEGGIVRQEGPIDISNVMYVHKGTATRVGIKMDGDKKVRVAKKTGKVID